MPEGPELNLSARFINQICHNRIFSGRILKSEVSRQPDIDWDEESYTISASSRGKELKLFLQSLPKDGKQYKKAQFKTLDIVFQFGMSGKFNFYEANELQKHAHLNFFTKANTSEDVKMVLSFTDYRRFGKWQPNGNWSTDRGPCVLTEYLPFRENVLKNIESTLFNKPICEVLLNQKYFNGIGNYLRAEICYRAGIRPFESAKKVLEPLLNKDSDIKVKSEDPDVLQLCHLLANEVINLGGTGYDPEDRDPDYSKFTEWLQCYYKPGMKNMADHNKRTMWYAGDPGPLTPSVVKERSVKRKKKKSTEEKTKKMKIEEQNLKEEKDKVVKTEHTEVKVNKRLTRQKLKDSEKAKKQTPQKRKPVEKKRLTGNKKVTPKVDKKTKLKRDVTTSVKKMTTNEKSPYITRTRSRKS